MKMIFGDLLDIKCGVICHQVNIHGTMGGGIAYYLAQKYPGLEESYQSYINDFKMFQGEGWEKSILGSVFYHIVNADLIIANCFSQYPDKVNGSLTSYDAVIECLNTVTNDFERDGDFSIKIPFQYGCGIAGGNWNIIKEIIKDSDIDVITRVSDYQAWINQ